MRVWFEVLSVFACMYPQIIVQGRRFFTIISIVLLNHMCQLCSYKLRITIRAVFVKQHLYKTSIVDKFPYTKLKTPKNDTIF